MVDSLTVNDWQQPSGRWSYEIVVSHSQRAHSFVIVCLSYDSDVTSTATVACWLELVFHDLFGWHTGLLLQLFACFVSITLPCTLIHFVLLPNSVWCCLKYALSQVHMDSIVNFFQGRLVNVMSEMESIVFFSIV